MLVYPKFTQELPDLDYKLGIKSSLNKIASVIGLTYAIYVASGRKSHVEFSEEYSSRSLTKIRLKSDLLAEIKRLFPNIIDDSINTNPLINAQMEALQVGLQLIYKLACISFNDGSSSTRERTGGNRFAKQLDFGTYIRLLDLFITSHNQNEQAIEIANWINNQPSTNETSISIGIKEYLTIFSEDVPAKIRTSEDKEIIFKQNCIYDSLLNGDTVIESDAKENVGPFRIFKSVFKEGIHPYIKVDNGLNLADKSDLPLSEYAQLVNNELSMFPKRETITTEIIKENEYKGEVLYNKVLPLQVIYYGAPGTGKSHTVDGIVEEDSDNYQRVTFHPDTDYSSFVGCYKPTKDPDTDKLTYAFVAQPFLTAYIEAWKRYAKSLNAIEQSEAEPYYLFIEEINRGNCAQIFGDVFQLLDRNDSGFSKYSVTPDTDITHFLAVAFADINLPDEFAKIVSGEKMRLPNNLYIYATMNTSDQSLFPIDSAFKRRWDWKYKPITDGGKGYVIDIDGISYNWYTFISTINKSIFDATHSEDKQMGYWFVHLPEGDTTISQETFISKVLFYLWSDIYKDFGKGGNNIFQAEDAEGKKSALQFHEFFEGDVTQKIHDFMRHNGIVGFPLDEDKGIEVEETDDNRSNDNNGTADKRKNKYTFSVNGKEIKSMVGVVKEALDIYIENNPNLSADEIVTEWKKLDIGNVYHFIETQAEFEERKSASKDATFDTKAVKISAKDGGVFYISNQYGTSKFDGSKNVDLVIERINAQNWGIVIKEL